MLRDLVSEALALQYEERLLLWDVNGFYRFIDYERLLTENGFIVMYYDDVEAFRLKYEKDIKPSEAKVAVILTEDLYVPYDIRRAFHETELTLGTLFPKLDETVLLPYTADIDIIAFAYRRLFGGCLSKQETLRFILDTALSASGINEYAQYRISIIQNRIKSSKDHPINRHEWAEIALEKALIEVNAARVGISVDFAFVDDAFQSFVFGDYSMLAGSTDTDAPAILTQTLDFITKGKAALIVMDGMSLFDFSVLSRHLNGIDFEQYCTYAMIPTTTAISRQSLLSGKYSRKLANPFTLNREEKEFFKAAEEHGYTRKQAAYVHGYDVNVSRTTRLLAVILNDIDDIVHGQRQGRRGMYNDINLFAESGKLQALIRSLINNDYMVYLTSDHGNTVCSGIGALRNTGVEMENKAKRAFILKDFAQVDENMTNHTLEFPGYYLDKGYRYLVCKTGISFDNVGIEVMTHGGITLDEVIVPFIKIRAVK